MSAAHISDDQFENEVLKSDQPVLVDFFATWCGPCKMLAPTIDELADEYKGKVKVVKLDIDESPETPQKFGVQSIPTLVFFKNGEVVEQKVGVLSKDDLKTILDS